MPRTNEDFLLRLLQACAAAAPQPLYPVHYARATNLDRDLLDEGLDELRRRGLVSLTEWIKGSGQGCALTEAGQQTLASGRLAPSAPPSPSGFAESRREPSPYDRGEIVRSAILEPRKAYAARVLLVVNLLFFAFGAYLAWRDGYSVSDYLQGKSTATKAVLIEMGALHPLLVFPTAAHPTQRVQFERILLFFFLHIGLLHLFMNMYFLGSIGSLIENLWGSARFLAIYFVAGIVSGCVVLQIALWQGEAGLTAGASGALYGMFVSLIVWFVLNRQHLPERLIQAWSRNIGSNLILLIVINFFPGISWQGHLGGAVGGLLAALLLHVQRFHPNRAVRTLALIGVPMVPVAFFLALLRQAGWF